jgi:protocatechuate 3,4-dioxygenase alpha subunit
MSLQATTWQTVGPFFRIGFEHLDCNDSAPQGTPGERVKIEGRVFDGHGVPVPDAVIEIWQANAEGEYGGIVCAPKDAAVGFSGFGRIATDEEGRFSFTTVRPGAVPSVGGQMQSPHLAVRVLMRGLLKDLVTRMYFPCETVASDPVLQLVPKERRATLVATWVQDRAATLLWEIRLQGDKETVFFDC